MWVVVASECRRESHEGHHMTQSGHYAKVPYLRSCTPHPMHRLLTPAFAPAAPAPARDPSRLPSTPVPSSCTLTVPAQLPHSPLHTCPNCPCSSPTALHPAPHLLQLPLLLAHRGLAEVALVPVGPELDHLVRILQCLVHLLQLQQGSAAVAVQVRGQQAPSQAQGPASVWWGCTDAAATMLSSEISRAEGGRTVTAPKCPVRTEISTKCLCVCGILTTTH